MHRILFLLCCLLSATTVNAAELILFEHDNFNGRRFPVRDMAQNLAHAGFNDKASSVVVTRGIWQLCDDAGFRGACITLRPGEYASLRALGMNDRISSVRELSGRDNASPSFRERDDRQDRRRGGEARMVLYEHAHFGGRALAIGHHALRNFTEAGFNDRASSLRVESGQWLLCSDADFQGACFTFGPGEYPQLPRELQDRVSSARRMAQRSPRHQNSDWNHSPWR